MVERPINSCLGVGSNRLIGHTGLNDEQGTQKRTGIKNDWQLSQGFFLMSYLENVCMLLGKFSYEKMAKY